MPTRACDNGDGGLESPVKDEPDVEALLEPMKNLTLYNKNACLLGLPAELRNTIYRLVLVSPDLFIIDSNNHTLPSLITTSRQLHNETLNIYLTENRFQKRVRDLKPDMPANPLQHWSAKIPLRDFTLRMDGSMTNWQNLKQWMRNFHQNAPGVFAMKVPLDAGRGAHDVVRKAFVMALAMRVVPWARAAFVLEAYKEGTEFAGFTWT